MVEQWETHQQTRMRVNLTCKIRGEGDVKATLVTLNVHISSQLEGHCRSECAVRRSSLESNLSTGHGSMTSALAHVGPASGLVNTKNTCYGSSFSKMREYCVLRVV